MPVSPARDPLYRGYRFPAEIIGYAVQLRMGGTKHWLWRAVDRDGLVLDIPVQERRNQAAAEAFLRRARTWPQDAGRRPRSAARPYKCRSTAHRAAAVRSLTGGP